MEITFDHAMEAIVMGFEIAGVAVLVAGSLTALATAVASLGRLGREGAYEYARRGIGRAILLGLELLIIADIVMTITIEATLEGAATLGIVVLVRTFLSFSLEVELEGSLPWRKNARDATPRQPA